MDDSRETPSTRGMTKGKLKLLVVIGTLDHVGGAERQALYLTEHLAGLQLCDVEVLTFRDGAATRAALASLGVSVNVVPYDEHWPRRQRAKALAKLGLLLRLHVKPEALLPFGAPSSKVMGLVWPLTRARFCWWNQQDEGRCLNGTRVEAKLLKRMPAINSNSFVGRDFLAQTYGLEPESVAVYNNGTPLSDASGIRIDWRSHLDLGDRNTVTMVANLTAFKDHSTLLQAWAHVRNHFAPAARPALLLAGYLKEKRTVEQLKLQAFDLGLSNSDVFFLGAVENVSGLLADSDLVVHSSVAEGCPNAVCEAMAAGRPVVATDIPGCRQALGKHQDRWLVEPHNAVMLAQRIIELLEAEEVRSVIGAVNRQRIESEFSVGGMNRFFQSQIENGLGRSLS